MSLFANLKTDQSIQEDKDTLGGGARIVESGLYDCTVKMAHIGYSKGRAMSLNLELLTDTGSTVKQTLWMTSGEAKGCKNYYEKDGVKKYLPGFIMANHICLLTLNKEIADVEPEEKVINLYSFEAKAEVPTKSLVLTDLMGKKFTGGIIKQIVDKNIKDASGAYVPSGETREENELDKVFYIEDGRTVAEIKAQQEEAKFKTAWGERWTGKDRNRSKAAKGGNAPQAGAPAAGATAGAPVAPTNNIFM